MGRRPRHAHRRRRPRHRRRRQPLGHLRGTDGGPPARRAGARRRAAHARHVVEDGGHERAARRRRGRRHRPAALSVGHAPARDALRQGAARAVHRRHARVRGRGRRGVGARCHRGARRRVRGRGRAALRRRRARADLDRGPVDAGERPAAGFARRLRLYQAHAPAADAGRRRRRGLRPRRSHDQGERRGGARFGGAHPPAHLHGGLHRARAAGAPGSAGRVGHGRPQREADGVDGHAAAVRRARRN